MREEGAAKTEDSTTRLEIESFFMAFSFPCGFLDADPIEKTRGAIGGSWRSDLLPGVTIPVDGGYSVY